MESYDGYVKYDSKVAESYEKDRNVEEHWLREQSLMERFCSDHAIGSILDLPVGTGRFLQFYNNADSIVGADISAEMLSVATTKASGLSLPALSLEKGDVLQLHYADSSFDTVVCFRLLHLLPPELVIKAVRELARVTRTRLVLQIYAATPPRKRSPARSMLAKFIAPVRLALASRKPWSHIKSHSHSHQFIADACTAEGLKLDRCHQLCRYESSSVEVLEFLKP